MRTGAKVSPRSAGSGPLFAGCRVMVQPEMMSKKIDFVKVGRHREE